MSYFYTAAINKVPKPGWLQTTEVYRLTLLEARSLNQSVCRTMLPLMALGGASPCLFQLLMFAGNL